MIQKVEDGAGAQWTSGLRELLAKGKAGKWSSSVWTRWETTNQWTSHYRGVSRSLREPVLWHSSPVREKPQWALCLGFLGERGKWQELQLMGEFAKQTHIGECAGVSLLLSHSHSRTIKITISDITGGDAKAPHALQSFKQHYMYFLGHRVYIYTHMHTHVHTPILFVFESLCRCHDPSPLNLLRKRIFSYNHSANYHKVRLFNINMILF